MEYRKGLQWGCLMMLVILFAACSHVSSRKDAPGTSLDSRIASLWTAKKEGHWVIAYDFYCSEIKEARTIEDFVGGSKLKIRDFSIEDIHMTETGETALVKIRFDSEVQGFELKNIRITEVWKKEGGNWYACPENWQPQSIIESQ